MFFIQAKNPATTEQIYIWQVSGNKIVMMQAILHKYKW
jgi:hypothetical protein